MTPEQIRQIVREELAVVLGPLQSQSYDLSKHLQLRDGRNIRTGTTTGTKIGTTTAERIGFWGVTPVDQPGTLADPTGGGTVDAEARITIGTIIDKLQEIGLIA